MIESVATFPSLPDKAESILRFSTCFTHTSGLPDELPSNADLRRQQVPLARFVDEIIKTELLFTPGTQFSYSSSGTILVAEIVQRLCGRSIRDFVRDEIIKPLGLKSTGLGSQGFARERLVRTTIPDYQVGSPGNWNTSIGKSSAHRRADFSAHAGLRRDLCHDA